MRIFTSRYQNKALAQREDLVKVGISIGHPRWPLGYKVEYIDFLCPRYWMLRGVKDGILTHDAFRVAYLDQLEKVGFEAVRQAIGSISERNGGRDVVLLCYEDLDKPDAYCHRRYLGEWIAEKAGVALPAELPTPTLREEAPACQLTLF